MPLVAAERPVRRIVMINAVIPVPGKSFEEAFDFKEVFATWIARMLARRARIVRSLPTQGIASVEYVISAARRTARYVPNRNTINQYISM
jgi:hypothetical protein